MKDLFQEALQRLLYAGAARTFEQYGIPVAGDFAQLHTGLFRMLEKIRGALVESRADGGIYHLTGHAAYPNEHINAAFDDITAYVAMQALGPTAEFEHLP